MGTQGRRRLIITYKVVLSSKAQVESILQGFGSDTFRSAFINGFKRRYVENFPSNGGIFEDRENVECNQAPEAIDTSSPTIDTGPATIPNSTESKGTSDISNPRGTGTSPVE